MTATLMIIGHNALDPMEPADTDRSAAQPAELCVLTFADTAAARAWLQSADGRKRAGKTVLLMDPSGAAAAAAANVCCRQGLRR